MFGSRFCPVKTKLYDRDAGVWVQVLEH
jgi:hypothetical protein